MIAQYHFQGKRYPNLAREVNKKGIAKYVCERESESKVNHVERSLTKFFEKANVIRLKDKLAC